MKLIGVDVGGTFTDVVLFDSETDETVVHKVPTTSDDPSRGVMQGVLGALPQRRDRSRRDHARLSWHDDRDQRGARVQGRAHRDDNDQGVSGHHPYRPASAADALFDHAGDSLAASPAGAPRFPQGRGRAAGAAARRGAQSRSTEDEVRPRRANWRERASKRSPSAFCFPISIRRMKSAPRRSCWRNSRRRSSPPRPPSCRNSASSNASPRRP